MKGIILAGGLGTRLYPATKVISKQMLTIYDKPLIYFPLSTLMLAEIKSVLIISTPQHIHLYKELLGDGSNLGMDIQYKVQNAPKGIAEAFILGEDFIGKDNVCLILGDNFFYGHGFSDFLTKGASVNKGAMIFGYPVNDPRSFGVVEFDQNRTVISIEEKPQNPKSNYAIPGIYFFDNTVIEKAKLVKPSARGELEITSVLNQYLIEKELKVNRIGRGLAWLDTGTPDGLLQASNFVQSIQNSQGLYIACLEEIAWRKRFITLDQLKEFGKRYASSDYGKYILNLGVEND